MADLIFRLTNFLNRLSDAIGLDIIPYAIGLKVFTSDPPFQPTKLSDIENKVQGLSTDKAEEALSYCKDMLEKENDRGEKIESKAYNLIEITGISTAFVTGSSFLFERAGAFSVLFILIFYILIVFSLTLTVLLASKVVIVGKYKYAYPDIADVFEMNSIDLDKIRTNQISTYMYCYARNSQIHNIKASYLMNSQRWFRNAVVLFLLLALCLSVNIAQATNSASPSSTISVTVTETPTASNTAIKTTKPSFTSTPWLGTPFLSSATPNNILPPSSTPIVGITSTPTP